MGKLTKVRDCGCGVSASAVCESLESGEIDESEGLTFNVSAPLVFESLKTSKNHESEGLNIIVQSVLEF